MALDADTQFETSDHRLLSTTLVLRPRPIGAVAGNAKVGNRVNIATRCQALEYINRQATFSAALATLGSTTVVPGAVGARVAAFAARPNCGLLDDTLAEDQI